MKKDLLKIINHYGVIPQLKYFQSEVFELNEAIMEYENFNDYCPIEASFISINGEDKLSTYNYSKKLKEHIAEEISDCYVMLEQFRLYYDIPVGNIKEVMEYKVKRQLERIKNEDN